MVGADQTLGAVSDTVGDDTLGARSNPAGRNSASES